MPEADRAPSHDAQGSLLLVSGDRPWLASATAFLVGEVRSLATVETAPEALAHAMNRPPDVVVIAPPIGEVSPLALIKQLSELRDGAALGITYVTDREREELEHARLMRAGANDWFPRGLPPAQAAKRIAALLADVLEPAKAIIDRGPLNIDIPGRRASVGGQPISLTALEFRLLVALARAVGRRLTHGELVAALRMQRGSQAARSVPVTLLALREKLGAAAGLLEISRRDGFRLRFVGPS